MKKFLVGIVTLVAAVMLSSPAFGALDNPYGVGFDGEFTFYKDIGGSDLSTLIGVVPTDEIPFTNNPSPDQIIAALPSDWGGGLVTFDQEYNLPDPTSTSGSKNLDTPVQILSAKWGTIQYAFLFEDYVKRVDWDGLSNGLSNVKGFNAVPVPAAVWLLGSGVLGLVAVRRRRS